MEALTGLSTGIEMRKKELFSFRERSAHRRLVFGKMLTYLMPAALAKGGLMKILGENSLQPAKESHSYYTRLRKNYKFAGIFIGQL
jgi:hypothetical protein